MVQHQDSCMINFVSMSAKSVCDQRSSWSTHPNLFAISTDCGDDFQVIITNNCQYETNGAEESIELTTMCLKTFSIFDYITSSWTPRLNGHAVRRTDAQLNKTGKHKSCQGKSSQISSRSSGWFMPLSPSLLCYRHRGYTPKLNSISASIHLETDSGITIKKGQWCL